MYGETIENRNITPLIYTSENLLHYQERDRFIEELVHLYNKYGIDSRLEMHDFILAETTWNFIAAIHNAKVAELKGLITIKESDDEIEAFVKSASTWECTEGYIFKDENGNVINATKIVLEKKKKEYNKGTKVRHKTKGMVETIVGVCKIKYMGAWVDGVIYEGNDTNTGEPMTFVRVKEDFENNFEVL